MDIFGRGRFFERVFSAIILLTLWSFAYYFTTADLEEVQSRFANRRAVLVKLLAHEINGLLDRHLEVEPRLNNLLAEESVVYAVIQLPEGEIFAQASQIPIESLQKIEAEALKASHLTFLNFADSTGLTPMVEATIPLFTETGKKILRIGFQKSDEEERISQVLFRNILLFSTLLLGLITYWLIRRRGSSGLQITWMGATGLLVLILFLSSRYTIQEWYERNWRQNFVQQGMSLAKVMAVPIKRFFRSGGEPEMKELQALLELDENFAYMGIIQENQYLYHSDPYLKGKTISDPLYLQVLNSDKPVSNRLPEEELYEVLVPILDGQRRIGVFQFGFRNSSGFGPLSQLRNKIVLLFTAFLVLALSLIYLLSRRISKDLSLFIRSMEQVTAGDLRQNVYLDRNDEFGQLSQAYNFMLMGLKERDLLGKGLQNYVSRSIVEKTLKVLSTEERAGEKVFTVTLFGYFHGLSDAMTKIGAPAIFAAVKETFQTFKRFCGDTSGAVVQMNVFGITTQFCQHSRHETLMHAIRSAQLINTALAKNDQGPFSLRLVLHAHELLHGALDDSNSGGAFLGDAFPDFRPLASAQERSGEILLSEELSYLVREISNLDEIEVHTQEQGHLRAYVFRNFKSPELLIKLFSQANSWIKILTLKLLKGYAREDSVEHLIGWFSDPDPDIRYHVMDALERLRPVGNVEFIVKSVKEEQDPRVLSRVISVLGRIGNESHIPLLAEKLRTGDRRVKANAVEALETIGGKKVYEFLNLLVDEQDNRVKANILIALGKYGDLKVFDLLNRMIKDSDKNMRASAAYALGRLGMVQGVEPLIASLSDKDLVVRRQVVASLTSLKADLEVDM